MAHGYARATGKAESAWQPVVLVQRISLLASPMLTWIAFRLLRSPVRFSAVYWQGAFQETDFFGMTLPVVKHSFLVLEADELQRIIKEAFHIATSGRPGPVVVDIPKDVQRKIYKPVFPGSIHLPGYPEPPKATDEELLKVLELLSEAKKPVLYTGGGFFPVMPMSRCASSLN